MPALAAFFISPFQLFKYILKKCRRMSFMIEKQKQITFNMLVRFQTQNAKKANFRQWKNIFE